MAERPAILLLQNGVLGSLAEARSVLQTARPDIDPTFMIGLTTHGVTRIAGDRFGVFHAGPGHTHIGLALDQQRSAAAEHLLDTLAAAWACLDTTVLPPEQIHSSAILKLAINACLNPTVALIGCTNGGLVASEHGRRLVTQLAAELLPVLAHETAAAPVPASASPKALADIVMGIAARTKSNRNSMLVDVQAGRQTEIDYINAYFVQRGRELGISMPTHELIADMVRLRTALSEQQK
ncbi:2-dehydropantoate 2-reductase (Ketopantoate reductase) (KPA reductase) (KPR) [Polyrhizophydium stewartii]|uniref:2-dehydropantoate 2-reductase (Ketopantoate reductase) (KPA reductase) (KPR) n=1 Tax=Polyrhizophydium stewartii TaxID=2732419 RepID=A0ABR4N1F4_9FUNG